MTKTEGWTPKSIIDTALPAMEGDFFVVNEPWRRG